MIAIEFRKFNLETGGELRKKEKKRAVRWAMMTAVSTPYPASA